jgi:peptide/nickel transport system permease protein
MNDLQESVSPGRLAWMRFKKNRLALFGLGIIVVGLLVSLLGSMIRPDKAQDANSQFLSLSKKGINFQVEILQVRKNAIVEEGSFWSRLMFGGAEQLYTEIPLDSYAILGDSITGFAYGGADGVAGLPFGFHLADVVYAIDPETIQFAGSGAKVLDLYGNPVAYDRSAAVELIARKHIDSRRFLLGTDKFGRDLLSRLMAGTIISLSVGLISVLISLVLGIGLGAIAGFFGGWIDDLITWLINVVWSIPTLLLVIAITFALGKGFVQVFIAVGLTMWVEVARVVRGQVLSLRNMEYIEAARALGYSNARTIYRHIIPNILGPVIVISAANFASAILLEAGLSFLGIGAQIPMASWGQMIKEHYSYITTDMAYLAILPGMCIIGLVLAFMLVGSGLRDSMDTRSAH